MVGNELTSPTDLAIGAVVNPGFEPLDLQLIKMEKKVAAGAQFFQTQAIYDVSIFEKFMEKARRSGCPIQYGTVVIKSPEMAQYMNEHVSGIRVPDSIIGELASVPKETRKEKASRDHSEARWRHCPDGSGHSLHAPRLVGRRPRHP